MKKAAILLLFSVLFLTACEEAMNPLPIIRQDGERRVLVEEFSGGNCKPCSEAAGELANLQATYGENLVVVTLHTFLPTPQASPAAGATYDFRIQKGTEVLNQIGIPTGIPAAGINRQPYGDGGSALIAPFSSWAGWIGEEVKKDAALGMSLDIDYDPAGREAKFDVNMLPNEPLTGDLRLTVYITEGDIADKQLTEAGVVNFTHQHILRDVISAPQGDNLATSLPAGQRVSRSFSYTVPAADNKGPWVAENCHIVAFVTLVDAASGRQEVLQVVEEKLN
ncbi:MAG TPA: Omp28-related outer membrane protein [Flavilitoribacter sp.]|nr:Omp28-related outer membrane protein [Flavilitoribacter sp.]